MTPPFELDRSQLERLDKEDLISIILALQEQVQALQETVAEQTTEIQKLHDELAKNSRNSGKPPSGDGLKKARTNNLRRKSGRRSGGQKGHKGYTLKMVEEPDRVWVHKASACSQCAANLQAVEPCGHERRQVFDIPPVHIEVTEHQAEIKVCAHCRERVKANFPSAVRQPVQYGARIKAQAAYLNNYQLIPLARTCELLEDFYGHAPAEALVLDANAELVSQIEPNLEATQQQLIASDVVHFDESGLRVEGKLNWLHVASTNLLTYYGVHPKRGQEGMRAMGILPAFEGRAVHDHWKSYFAFDNCQHALCNAHHLRELQFIVDQYKQTWAEDMIQLLVDIKAEIHATPADQAFLLPDRLLHFAQRYDELVAQGMETNPPPAHPPPRKRGRKKQSPPKNLLDRLQQYKPQILAFIYDGLSN
jgi:transposase